MGFIWLSCVAFAAKGERDGIILIISGCMLFFHPFCVEQIFGPGRVSIEWVGTGEDIPHSLANSSVFRLRSFFVQPPLTKEMARGVVYYYSPYYLVTDA